MDAVQELIQAIRAAFHPSPLRLALTISLICLFVGGLVTFYLLEVRRSHLKERSNSEATFQQLSDRLKLLPSEQEIILRMAATLKSRNRKHLLLTNEGLFNTSAQRLLKENVVPEAAISALRVKLGLLGEGDDRVPVSTASLPVGSSIALRYRNELYQGRVLDPQTAALRVRVKLGGQVVVFFAGNEVQILYQNSRGMFGIRTNVLAQDGEYLSLSHSEDVDRTQKRGYYRREFDLPVYIRPSGSEEKLVRSRFLDLGGGGASLHNPAERYRKGDTLELAFQATNEDRITTEARVVRTSDSHSVLHVEFGVLRESTRDRIYRVLFNKSITA